MIIIIFILNIRKFIMNILTINISLNYDF